MRDKVIQLIKTITVKKTITGVAKLKIFEHNDIITIDTIWENNEEGYEEVLYVIEGRLQIEEGIKLTIPNNTQVLFVNGEEFYGQIIFETGSKLKAGCVDLYSIEPEVINKVSFEWPIGWKKGDEIIPRSKIANNGGLCFFGNRCPIIIRGPEISEFCIRNISCDGLGNAVFAAFNIYDLGIKNTKFDSIAFANCINNIFLHNSDVQIKKMFIENAENCLVIEDASSFTLTVKLTVQCVTFINADFEGSIIFTAGSLLNIVAGQAGAALRLAEEDVAAIDPLTLTSNGKAIKKTVSLFNADDPIVNQDKPEEIGGE